MKHKQIQIIFFILLVSPLFSQLNDNSTDQVDTEKDIKATLLYGIEGEIIALLNDLSPQLSNDLFTRLQERYQEAQLIDSKKAFCQFFLKCNALPPALLDLLSAQAEDNETEPELLVSLLPVLSKHGREKEAAFLVRQLDHDQRRVRQAAADALVHIEQPAIVEQLISRLELSDQSTDRFLPVEIKSQMILALGNLQAARAVPYLQKVLKDRSQSKFNVMYAMYSLAKIGDLDSLPVIREKLNHRDVKIQEYASYALSTFKSDQTKSILKKSLKHNNAMVRVYACQGLVLNQDHSAIEMICYKFKNDPAAEVRKEALHSLTCLGSPGISALKELGGEKKFSPHHLAVMSQAAASKPDQSNIPFLIELYQKGSQEEKEVIAKNIVKSNSNQIDPLLKLLLESEDFLIRIGAIRAVYLIENTTLWSKVKELAEQDQVKAVRLNARKYYDLHQFN